MHQEIHTLAKSSLDRNKSDNSSAVRSVCSSFSFGSSTGSMRVRFETVSSDSAREHGYKSKTITSHVCTGPIYSRMFPVHSFPGPGSRSHPQGRVSRSRPTSSVRLGERPPRAKCRRCIEIGKVMTIIQDVAELESTASQYSSAGLGYGVEPNLESHGCTTARPFKQHRSSFLGPSSPDDTVGMWMLEYTCVAPDRCTHRSLPNPDRSALCPDSRGRIRVRRGVLHECALNEVRPAQPHVRMSPERTWWGPSGS